MLKYLLKTVGVLCVLLGSIHGAEEAPPSAEEVPSQNPHSNWQRTYEINIPETMEPRVAGQRITVTHYPNRVALSLNQPNHPIIGFSALRISETVPGEPVIVTLEKDSTVESFTAKVEELRLRLESVPNLSFSVGRLMKHRMEEVDRLAFNQVRSPYQGLLDASDYEAFFKVTRDKLTLDLLQKVYNELKEQKEQFDLEGLPIDFTLVRSVKAYENELALRKGMGKHKAP